jgi:hypothetical protein
MRVSDQRFGRALTVAAPENLRQRRHLSLGDSASALSRPTPSYATSACR